MLQKIDRCGNLLLPLELNDDTYSTDGIPNTPRACLLARAASLADLSHVSRLFGSRILQDSPPHAYPLLLGHITRNPSFARKKIHRCRSSHHPLTDNLHHCLVSFFSLKFSIFFTGFSRTQQAAITSSSHQRLSTRRFPGGAMKRSAYRKNVHLKSR